MNIGVIYRNREPFFRQRDLVTWLYKYHYACANEEGKQLIESIIKELNK
jgi:hypothetical protein